MTRLGDLVFSKAGVGRLSENILPEYHLPGCRQWGLFLHPDLERSFFPEAGPHSDLLETLGYQHVGSKWLF